MILGIETKLQFDPNQILYQCGSCGHILKSGSVDLPPHLLVSNIRCDGIVGRRITYGQVVERRLTDRIISPL